MIGDDDDEREYLKIRLIVLTDATAIGGCRLLGYSLRH
jgi:hypothetical protein